MTISEAYEAIEKALKVTTGSITGILEEKDDNIYFDIDDGEYLSIDAYYISKLMLVSDVEKAEAA